MTLQPEKKFHKRDLLRDIEIKCQAFWEENKIFEANPDEKREKYFVNFPFPYMNGKLHLGHTFTITKIEFAAGYQRLKGKVVLFPFGFHCTGMPIKACADKLKREIELFGPTFENYSVETVEEPSEKSTDPQKKHSKALAKTGDEKYQFQIMQSIGVPVEEIVKFADPHYWLYYFPPRAIQDLKGFGLRIDWRRSFITTDVNPYYDSFIHWQFNKLKASNPPKIDFGERYCIYSPIDGQPCMDHDRSRGEGVGVQEYTGIKIKVLLSELNATPVDQRDKVKDIPVGAKLSTPEMVSALNGKSLYLVAATMRPETMYGQTNCFVGVDLPYGIYEVSDTEAWVCTERAARNMTFQGLFTKHAKGTVVKLGELVGWDLVGVPLKAPLTAYQKVYCLPMEGVLANKGTGIVTSVPSDSPVDYVTLLDLVKKSAYYHVQPKWIEPFLPPIPVIQTPNLGNLAAVKVVTDMKISSQKDKVQLEQAKDKVYNEGFHHGTMLLGEHKGMSVQKAKPLTRKLMMATGEAFVYCEPENLVISRSGDECVVTLADQWYMNYGEEEWKKQALECLAQMNVYHDEARNNYEKTLDWLNQWACSRSFGLGSRLPWDKSVLIESLSDSTIYMAYYTVAHFLQSNAIDGSKQGLLNIEASQLSDEVWEYIFNKDAPVPKTTIPLEHLDKMKREFSYFYPFDLRVSGKDLISNHLTFSIYNHVAIFPKEKWPKSFRVNGHLLLNGEKMSKSSGNFMTLEQAIETYGADSTRFALADSGDFIEDANFVEKTANNMILRLFTEIEWIQDSLKEIQESKLRKGTMNWADRVFLSEMQQLVMNCEKCYDGLLFREALKYGFFDLMNARNEYRKITTPIDELSNSEDDLMHEDVILEYISTQSIVISPICPHWSEHVWMHLLKNKGSIQNASWPTFTRPINTIELAESTYLRDLAYKIRAAEDAAAKKRSKKQGTAKVEGSTTSKTLKITVAKEYPEWQVKVLESLKESYDFSTNTFIGNEMSIVGAKGLLKDKRVMPFLTHQKMKVLKEYGKFLLKDLIVLNIKDVQVIEASGETLAVPGSPIYELI